MSQQRENIRIVLEREIPEIRTGDSIGVLFGLLISMAMLISIGVLLAFIVVPSPGAIPLLGFPILVLGLSYAVGHALDGSTRMVGADLTNASVKAYNGGAFSASGRDGAAHGIQLGLILMALQVLAGAMYGTIKHYRERDLVPDDKRSRIAAAFVEKMLGGPTRQEILFSLPAVKEFSVEEKCAALRALVCAGFAENLPTGIQLGRGVREKL